MAPGGARMQSPVSLFLSMSTFCETTMTPMATRRRRLPPALAQAMSKSILRPADRHRYGGEEFVGLLPDTDSKAL